MTELFQVVDDFVEGFSNYIDDINRFPSHISGVFCRKRFVYYFTFCPFNFIVIFFLNGRLFRALMPTVTAMDCDDR